MALSYLVIDSFSILFLLILYASTREQSKGLTENRRFCMIVLMTIAALFGDMFAWQLDGQGAEISRHFLWFFNILCFVLSGTMSLSWFHYVGIKLNRNVRLPLWLQILIALPCCVLIAASISTPWTHQMFELDVNNVYHRGPLFLLQIIIPFGYLLAAALRAGLHARRVRLRQQRRECLFLCSFIIFPLIGGILQFSTYGLSMAWPCTALSLMLVYVNLQNQKISLDALTGLNNRGQFDKYLYGCMERADEHTPFALFMLDIDEFKKINDRFGHTAGDAALISAAGILKRALGDSNAFLARYGGDEFAVVINDSTDAEIQRTLERIETEAERYNAAEHRLPCRLVFSVGYVRSDQRRFSNYQDMIAAADARMYLQKQQHKALRE